MGEADARLRRRGGRCRQTLTAASADPRRRDGDPGAPHRGRRPQVLMGQRGPAAAFMPDKFVFPGGAVDPTDLALPAEAALEPETARRLALDAAARARPGAAARGGARALGGDRADARPARPGGGGARGPGRPGAGFFAAGLLPDTAALRLRLPRRHAAGPAAPLRRPLLPRRGRGRWPATTVRLGRRARGTCTGSTSPRPARCRCRSSPRWCSPSSRRCLADADPGAAGAVLPPGGRTGRTSACSDA